MLPFFFNLYLKDQTMAATFRKTRPQVKAHFQRALKEAENQEYLQKAAKSLPEQNEILVDFAILWAADTTICKQIDKGFFERERVDPETADRFLAKNQRRFAEQLARIVVLEQLTKNTAARHQCLDNLSKRKGFPNVLLRRMKPNDKLLFDVLDWRTPDEINAGLIPR